MIAMRIGKQQSNIWDLEDKVLYNNIRILGMEYRPMPIMQIALGIQACLTVRL